MILAIDPGAHTGLAVFVDGQLVRLETVEPHQMEKHISAADRVIFEDSRLISHVYTTTKSRAAALKMARNVGEIDAWCKLIVAICGEYNIPCHSVSPKGKGEKVNAEKFKTLTGWDQQSNQHERDAAMVGWMYRRAV